MPSSPVAPPSEFTPYGIGARAVGKVAQEYRAFAAHLADRSVDAHPRSVAELIQTS